MNVSVIFGEKEVPKQNIETRSHKGIYYSNLTTKKCKTCASLSIHSFINNSKVPLKNIKEINEVKRYYSATM